LEINRNINSFPLAFPGNYPQLKIQFCKTEKYLLPQSSWYGSCNINIIADGRVLIYATIRILMKKKKAINGTLSKQTVLKRKCPYVSNPFDYCYCSSMNSSDTKNLILYCGGIYEDCKFYKHAVKNKEKYLKKDDINKN